VGDHWRIPAYVFNYCFFFGSPVAHGPQLFLLFIDSVDVDEDVVALEGCVILGREMGWEIRNCGGL
jgi:hypothetical protein